jgi:NAD(P)-dependent dehydrogenase (short-subunit alcohol dehydrogenase family)
MTLKGKVAVVTGGSRGIGRAIAERLAADGALVCVNYRANAEAAAEVVHSIESAGGEAFALQADVGTISELSAFFEALDAELTARRGDRGFDILVNNAGVSGGSITTTEADFDRVFATNVKGPFFTTQHALSRIKDGGRIINVSSNLSRHPMARGLSYCMTKAAIDNFTVGLAGEVGPRGITVNTLAPGLTRTELNTATRAIPGVEDLFSSITALGRIGEVDDIARAAAFLASPDASWVTGVYLEASGGLGLVLPMPKPKPKA